MMPGNGRWDGWDDLDYEPTEAELNELVALEISGEGPMFPL